LRRRFLPGAPEANAAPVNWLPLTDRYGGGCSKLLKIEQSFFSNLVITFSSWFVNVPVSLDRSAKSSHDVDYAYGTSRGVAG
jgi:hypothetical protein